MPKQHYTDAELLEILEGIAEAGPINWTAAAKALGYNDSPALRRRVKKTAAVIDTRARTLTLPSGKVLPLRGPGREVVARRAPQASNTAALDGVRRARIARDARRREIILGHLEDLAARDGVLELKALADALGVKSRPQAGRLLRRAEGLTVTAASVTLPDGRVVRRDQGGRPDKSDPREPTRRQREVAERRAAKAEARRARIEGLTRYLESCLRDNVLMTFDGLSHATGYSHAGAARNFLLGLEGFVLEDDAVVMPDGRRVERLPRGYTTRNGRLVKLPLTGAAARTRENKANTTRPRAAAVAAGAPSCPSPKPAHPSASAPRVSSLQPTAEAGATTPTPRASAGSSNVVALEAKAPRVPLPRDVFPAPGGCLWPEGHVGEPGFHFCGALQAPGKPYCRAHAARAYTVRVAKEAAE